MVISLNPEDWSHRRLCDGSRLPALASSLLTAESEIAAGRIALFTPRYRGFVSVALTRFLACQSGLSTRSPRPPWLSPGTLALCSPDFPLVNNVTSDHSLASRKRSHLKVHCSQGATCDLLIARVTIAYLPGKSTRLRQREHEPEQHRQQPHRHDVPPLIHDDDGDEFADNRAR